VNNCPDAPCTAGKLVSTKYGGGAAPPAYVIFTVTALARGVHPNTSTDPLPGFGASAGVGVTAGVGCGGVAPLAGVGVGGAVLVFVAAGVTVVPGVGVPVGDSVFVDVGEAVLVGASAGVGVAGLVGVGKGVAVFVAEGTGVLVSNRKFARAVDVPTRQTASTLMVTSWPGEPETVKLPLRFPPAVAPDPVASPGGADETVTIPPLHQPLPERFPPTDGAGPDEGLSTSVAAWAWALATRPGVARWGGIETASIAATRTTLRIDGSRLIVRLRLPALLPRESRRPDRRRRRKC